MPLTTLPRRLLTLAILASIASVAACDGSSPRRTADSRDASAPSVPAGIDPRMLEQRDDGVKIASRDSLLKTPGYIVDSIFPPEEALRRFRAEFSGVAPATLGGSMRTSDGLLRQYWRLLSIGDSVGLPALVLSKAEFAFLYLPESPEFKAGMPPQIAWLLLERTASTAVSKAREVAAKRGTLPVAGTTCPAADGAPGGDLRVFGPCGIIIRDGASRDTIWIASRVVAHRGIVKLLSYTNQL